MKHICNFIFNLKKERILKALDCYPNNSLYEEIENEYFKIEKLIKDIAKPEALFTFIDNKNIIPLDNKNKYKNFVFVLITLGEEITKQIEVLFDKGDYLKAMILDASASELLFNVEQQLYETIKIEAAEKGVGLSARISPGDDNIPITIQKNILDAFGENSLGITITEGFMLNPQKSLAYFYGTGKALSIPEKEHYCPECDNIFCTLREEPCIKGQVNLKIKDGYKIYNINAPKGVSIFHTLLKNHIDINSPCNGKGTCGKCKIRILKGTVFKNFNNYKHLSENEIKKGICLSCSSYPLSDLTVEITSIKDDDFEILSAYNEEDILLSPHVYKEELSFNESDLNGESLQSLISKKLNKNLVFSLESLKKISTLVNRSSKEQNSNSLYAEKNINLIINENKVIDICKKNDTRLYAIGIDIGTTTIVLSIVDLLTGKIVNSKSILNSQRQYGADVISRINHSIIDLNSLTSSIQKDLKMGFIELLKMERISFNKVYQMVIAGNTTMLHLLCGFYSESLALYPFNSTTLSKLELDYIELFNDNTLKCNVTILPSVSAYVGADITSGMLKCRFDKLKRTCLLIDIGTNGEMAIGDKDRIICLSTAAGPAFEGANIRCGIGSVPGAISTLKIKDKKVSYSTINNKTAVGICGSAVIDITAECVKNKIIDETGKFIELKELNITTSKDGTPITFTQKDIREVQLAKSAIRSGIEILVKNYGCDYSAIDKVFIAGGFGNNINIENAACIGLIPNELKEKIKIIGNSSLGGTINYILDKESKNVIQDILNITKYIDISTDKEFNDLFIENMMFEKKDS